MKSNPKSGVMTVAEADEAKIISDFLSASLDEEDKANSSSYREFLCRESWWPQLKPDDFEAIKDRLKILIEDTEKHIQILTELQEKYVHKTYSK
jgi:hypothetical protein